MFKQEKNSSANIYLFRVTNSNTRKRREICSKLTIMWLRRRSAVFIFNFEYISIIFTLSNSKCKISLISCLFMYVRKIYLSVSTVTFEQLNIC